MFNKGNLSEQTYRLLNHIIGLEIDVMRFRNKSSKKFFLLQFKNHPFILFMSCIEKIPLLSRIANSMRIRYSIVDYEKKWGFHQSCYAVLEYLETLDETETIPKHIVQEVRAVYLKLLASTQKYLNEVTDQFPEFVKDMQNRFVKRILLYAKYESIMHQVQEGLLPQSVAAHMTKDYLLQIHQLSKQNPEKLKLDPHNLLRQVPFFKNITNVELEAVIQLLKEHHAPADKIVIHQGDPDDALYIIIRGVIRVIKEVDGQLIEVATLMAGDFFGELALLHHIKRTATCKAITHCIIYVLTRKDSW